jgi:pimeloyl-ACP methyl ester carboxylesterase
MPNSYYRLFMASLLFLISKLCIASACLADTNVREIPVTLETKTGKIFGTLRLPFSTEKIPVALIISGSGPTDRNGNNPSMKNDALLKLAEGLSEKGIASLRYDKRGIAASRAAMTTETDLRFDDYVEDAKAWIALLKKDPRFSTVTVIGHSEGSLIGMNAVPGLADKFVSLAGAGRPADEILRIQFANLPKASKDLIFPMLDTLKSGKKLTAVDPSFFALFRPSVQPYMISWIRHNPQEEIKKLIIPVLILQGKKDIQVSVEDATLLHNSNPRSELVFLDKMNHILRNVEEEGREANIATYTNSSLPITPELVSTISGFILKK